MNIDICRKCSCWRERIFVCNSTSSMINMTCLKCRCDWDALQLDGAAHAAIVSAMRRNHVDLNFVCYGDSRFDDVSNSVLEYFTMKDKIKEREVPRECVMCAEQCLEEWN